MRRLSPAIFYAISPGGSVVRRFTVDSGDPTYEPIDMHIAGNRIAVQFVEPHTFQTIMKVVDLEGNDLATYSQVPEGEKPTMGDLGVAFACYFQQPERFLFLATDDDKHKIQFRVAEVH